METEFKTLTGKIVTVPEERLRDVQKLVSEEYELVTGAGSSSSKRKEPIPLESNEKRDTSDAPSPGNKGESQSKRLKLETGFVEHGEKKKVGTWDSNEDEEMAMIASLTEASMAGPSHDEEGDTSTMDAEDDALFLQIPDEIAKGQ